MAITRACRGARRDEVVAAALLLLTWLLLRGFAVDERPFNTAMQLLDEQELAEAAIRRDLLSTRAGLLRDYDPLVAAGRQVETAVARLRAFTTPQQANRLEAWRARQELLVEASKSDNALLRNSLAQFGRLTDRLSAPPGGGAPIAEAGRLGSAILHLTLDSSAPVLAEVRGALAGLRLQAIPASERGPAAALLAHGALLQDLLPRVDGLDCRRPWLLRSARRRIGREQHHRHQAQPDGRMMSVATLDILPGVPMFR